MEALKDIQLVFNPLARDMGGFRMHEFVRHPLVKYNKYILAGTVASYVAILRYLIQYSIPIPNGVHILFGSIIFLVGLTFVKRELVLRDIMDYNESRMKAYRREVEEDLEEEIAELSREPVVVQNIRRREQAVSKQPRKKKTTTAKNRTKFEEKMKEMTERAEQKKAAKKGGSKKNNDSKKKRDSFGQLMRDLYRKNPSN